MLRSLLAAGLILAATEALAQDVTAASFGGPTTRYAHGILGDAIEHGELVMTLVSGVQRRVVLPENRVFEDTEPRLFDVDGDGDREVIVVESDIRQGARLSIYDGDGLVAANAFIGQSNRWLSPAGIGAADLDGDGQVELAYVDRPHLAKTLRIFRFQNGNLIPLANLPGVTNHRIGERDIAGGIRDCGRGPEIIVASADWSRVLAVRFDGNEFSGTDLGAHRGRSSFASAMACE
ncbi:VCBS repeat-containing protein [Rhodobacteraceae bacterium]|nr:VCBS repeat-containing protein [Paracoccaceae bacterium]